ncbi:hypothetical protein TNCV_4437931 [Trichonephila clavipes]|nr:hypothetical protein TNCV_4437931 [Trichonephila clavipes]
MNDLVSMMVKLQDHLTQTIGLEILYLDRFANLVHNGLVPHLTRNTLPTRCLEERGPICLAAPVAET